MPASSSSSFEEAADDFIAGRVQAPAARRPSYCSAELRVGEFDDAQRPCRPSSLDVDLHFAALPFEHQKLAADRNAQAAARLLVDANANQLRQPIDRRLPLHAQAARLAARRVAAFGRRDLERSAGEFPRPGC